MKGYGQKKKKKNMEIKSQITKSHSFSVQIF